MSNKPLKRIASATKMLAAPYIVVVTQTGVGVDTDTITIDGDIYELDDDATITAGRVTVDITTATAVATMAALAAAINTQANVAKGILATALTAPGTVEQCIIQCHRPLAVTESLTNGTVSAAASYGGRGDAATINRVTSMLSRVPLATEVTDGVMHFMFPAGTTVDAAKVVVKVTSTGVEKVVACPVTISGNRVTIDNTGGTDFAATDTVDVIASLSESI